MNWKSWMKKWYKFIPLKNYIIFESRPDYSDNARAVFEEMIRLKYNINWKFVWFVEDDFSCLEKQNNVKFVKYSDKLRYSYYRTFAKVIVCCNRLIGEMSEKQKSFYLTHGTPLKDTSGYYTVPADKFSYMIAAGEGVRSLYSESFLYPEGKIIPLGYPRNDVLTSTKVDMEKLFGKYKKYVVWYPTVRQSKIDGKNNLLSTIPLIHGPIDEEMLNKCAEDLDVLLILKPHFAQEKSLVNLCQKSNIRVINDSFFTAHNIQSYELLASCDALLTDYSSVYFDFLICNKPVALILEDIEDYKKEPGLIKEFDYFAEGAEKVYDISDLNEFLKRLVGGEDRLRTERERINKLANVLGNNTAANRVALFIASKVGIK